MQRQNAITKQQKAGRNQCGIYFLLLVHDMLISLKIMLIFKKYVIDLDADNTHQQKSSEYFKAYKD